MAWQSHGENHRDLMGHMRGYDEYGNWAELDTNDFNVAIEYSHL